MPSFDTQPATFPPRSDIVQDRAARLAATVAGIEVMDLTALRALWAKNFGTPPALRSPDLMRLALSWRLQARAWGGIDAAMRKKLKRKTTIDGDGSDASILVDGTDTSTTPIVTIQNLAVAGNFVSDGIDVINAQLSVVNADVSSNDRSGIVVGIAGGASQVTVTSSSVSNNIDAGVAVVAGHASINFGAISSNGQGGIVVQGGGSRQPAGVFTYWRMGRASKSSLPTRMSG